MKNCVFCKIVNVEANESYRIIGQDDDYVVMLVNSPETRGHFIVFPKKHYSELAEFNEVGSFFEYVMDCAEKYTKKLNAKAFTLKLNNKLFMLDDNPMHVGHIHCHVIPRYTKNDFISEPKGINKEELVKIKKMLN